MALLVFSVFAAALLGCVCLKLSVLYALGIGYLSFFLYGLAQKHSAAALLKASLRGVRAVKNVLILLLLIGMMTALWRSAGTIPAIVCDSARLIHPSFLILACFLLNCLVSFLTGTAFGTVATMGVICMSIASAAHVSPVFTAGAILSGLYFGDRGSPVSTSALLISELTGTNLYRNIRNMVKTSLVPFSLTCGIYTAAGFLAGGHRAASPDVTGLFSAHFSLHWTALLPALVILVLSCLRVDVKITMLSSVLCAAVVSMALQGVKLAALLKFMVLGYSITDPRLSRLMNGGGIRSMVTVFAIIAISSSYSGLFAVSGLLNGARGKLKQLFRHTSVYGGVLLSAIFAALISCNQTLTILLTHQLCDGIDLEPEEFAISLENSAVVVSPLVPWSISAAVPLAALNAPAASIPAAVYLFLVPLWNLLAQEISRTKSTRHSFFRKFSLPHTARQS